MHLQAHDEEHQHSAIGLSICGKLSFNEFIAKTPLVHVLALFVRPL
jgi:hypothetical protein